MEARVCRVCWIGHSGSPSFLFAIRGVFLTGPGSTSMAIITAPLFSNRPASYGLPSESNIDTLLATRLHIRKTHHHRFPGPTTTISTFDSISGQFLSTVIRDLRPTSPSTSSCAFHCTKSSQKTSFSSPLVPPSACYSVWIFVLVVSTPGSVIPGFIGHYFVLDIYIGSMF